MSVCKQGRNSAPHPARSRKTAIAVATNQLQRLGMCTLALFIGELHVGTFAITTVSPPLQDEQSAAIRAVKRPSVFFLELTTTYAREDKHRSIQHGAPPYRMTKLFGRNRVAANAFSNACDPVRPGGSTSMCRLNGHHVVARRGVPL
jgi:hypothetical protein